MTASLVICVPLPLRIVSVANLREHWRTRANRARLHRSTAQAVLRSHPVPAMPVTVTLTRVSPRALDDDNLAHAFKAVRDGVADWLGLPDNNPAIRWQYAQRKGKPAGAEIVVEGGC